jgi:hypothetical protein
MYLRLIGLTDGSPHDAAGEYVVSYDPDYHLPDGSYDGGDLVTTPLIEKAGIFTPEEAMATYQASPKCDCHRLRPDGEPNRPLTAFDVEMYQPSETLEVAK